MSDTPDDADLDSQQFQLLIQGLRDGDERILREFCKQYGPLLHGIAEGHLAQNLRPRIDADDVVQSTFRTFFRRVRVGHFQFPDNQRLWNLMCAITLTKVREKSRYHLRQRRSVKQEVSTDSAAMDDSTATKERAFIWSGPSPHSAVQIAEGFEQLLASLSESEQRLVHLMLQDLTNDEIAEQLDVTERTVRKMVHRLEEKIEKVLEPQGDWPKSLG